MAYPVGSCVRVTNDALLGLPGVVIEVEQNGNHLLKIDDWGAGVYLRVRGTALELAESVTHRRDDRA
jgi:hypothetical protein